VFNKIKHNNTNIKFKKGLVKRTKEYIESQDPNRKSENDAMSRSMISSTVVSRLNAYSAYRNDKLNKQRETSQAMAQLNMRYNVLSREWNKKD
jgi:hypothetical protein